MFTKLIYSTSAYYRFYEMHFHHFDKFLLYWESFDPKVCTLVLILCFFFQVTVDAFLKGSQNVTRKTFFIKPTANTVKL